MKPFEKILLIIGIIFLMIAAVHITYVQWGWMIKDTPVKFSDRLDLFFYSWSIWFFVPGFFIMLYFAKFKK